MIQVFEDPNGLNFETDYQYDMLNNLLRVDQKGTAPTDGTQWRTRTFTYDSLSQLLCAANPEITPIGSTCPTSATGTFPAGAVTYSYDNDGNLISKTSPKPNQTSPSVTVVTTYTYNDPDNRLTKKSYNDGLTPTVQFAYDGATLTTGCPSDTPPGQTDNNPKGRRTAMCDASGGTSWIHDKMGRITSERRSISKVIGDYDTDTYNFDSSIASMTALGYSIAYTYNGAGRVTQVQNFADPLNYVMAAHYAPFGALTTATMGAKPINISNSYNKRLQPLTLSASAVATIMSLSYNFGLGTNDNGNVYQITNNRDNNRTQNFLYDSLNRIQQAYTTGTNWGETYGPSATNPGVPPTSPGIDAWGNLFQRSPVNGKTGYEPLSCQPDKQNHLATCAVNYDAAGNVMQYGSASYTYDAENRLISTAGMSYLYDGDGKRVEKCTAGTTAGTCASNATGTLYWTGTGSDPLAETDLAGNVLEDYVFFNGKRIARREPSSPATVHFYFSDHLGTHSLITDKNGTMPPQEESDYYPYGGEIPVSGSDSNHYKFTGKERDAESGNDYFGARYFASSMGRMLSPDPIGGDLTDPQSLNKYAYALNNPLRFTDPTGMYVCKTGQDCSAFEKALDGLRNSKNADVARAAAAYGALGQDNGVTVGFADLTKKGENGNTVSTIGVDPNDPSGKTLRANSDVTINSKISGDDLAATVGHEGSHAADAQDVVKSGLTEDGEAIHAGMNITPYQSEQRAYGVTNAILSSENQSRKFDCGMSSCTLGRGAGMASQLPGVIDQILAHDSVYNQGGKPMSSTNQGPSVVNGVTPTPPKAAVPH